MIDVGLMRQRVQVWGAKPPTPNEYGEPVAAEVRIAEVWAAVEPQGGAEAARAGKTEAECVYRVVLRHLAWVTPAHWLVWKGRRLEIDGARDPDGRGEWLELVCRSAGDRVISGPPRVAPATAAVVVAGALLDGLGEYLLDGAGDMLTGAVE